MSIMYSMVMVSTLGPQIRNILKQGIETPEDQNDLRKMQLRELARLNGTLREDDNRSVKQVLYFEWFTVDHCMATRKYKFKHEGSL